MKGRVIAFVALVVLTFLPVAVASPIATVVLAEHVGTGLDCGDSSNFKLLRFKWASTPVEVYFDGSIPGAFLAEVKAGVAPWEAEEHPSGDLAVEVSKAPANGITVSWGPIDGPLGTLAVTSFTYNIRTKAIVEVTVTFDSAENWAVGTSISCGIPVSQGISVIDVSTHEFGHALPALDHANGDALTMKPFYSGGHERTLATGDKLGIQERFGGGNGGGGGGGGPPPCHPRFGC